MTERAASELFTRIATELNLPSDWRLEFDKSKRRFGACIYSKRIISLSRSLVQLNNEYEVDQVIRHEIAHALVGPGHGHNHIWRAMAIRCGDDGKRCYNDADVETPQGAWEATCKFCGTVVKRHRALKPGRQVSCGVCSPRFDSSRVLTFVSTLQQTVETTDPQVAKILELRASGMGWVKIDAAFGVFGKKGWWSWKIAKDHSRG